MRTAQTAGDLPSDGDGEVGVTTAADPAPRDIVRQQISHNMVASVATRGLYLVTRVFVPPLTLMYVSLDEYGVWASSIVLASYLGMSAFGVANVYVRETASLAATGQLDRIGRLVATGIALVLVVGLALLAALWWTLPRIIELFGVPPALHATAFVIFFGTVAVLVLDLSFGAFAYVLQGLQRMAEERAVWMASVLLETALIVVFLWAGFGVYGLLWAFAIRYVVSTLLYMRRCYQALPGLSLRPSLDRDLLHLFSVYGGIIQLSGLLGIVLRSAERVLAGALIGVQATALYDLGEKLPMMGSMLASSMNGAFLPAATHLHASGGHGDVVKLYLKGSRYMNMAMGTLMGFLAAFAAPLIAVWIGADPRFAPAAAILAAFTYPYQINVLTGPGSAIFRGVKAPARELVYPLVQLALVAVTVAIGIVALGRTIAMINLTVATSMVVSAAIYIATVNRFLGVRERDYWRAVHLPGLLPYAFAFGLAALGGGWLGPERSRWETLAALTVAGALYAAVVPAILYRGCCDAGERAYLRGELRRLLARVRPRGVGAAGLPVSR